MTPLADAGPDVPEIVWYFTFVVFGGIALGWLGAIYTQRSRQDQSPNRPKATRPNERNPRHRFSRPTPPPPGPDTPTTPLRYRDPSDTDPGMAGIRI